MTKHLCQLLGANKIRSSPYHPSGNGISERVNRVVKPAIAKFVDYAGEDWDIYLDGIMAINAYNTTVHSSIGLTPFEAHFGRPALTVADVVLNNRLPSSTKLSNISEFTVQTFERASQIHKQIMDARVVAQERQKRQYDKSSYKFNVGDFVKIVNFTVRPQHSKAWEPKFLGPFQITRIFKIDHEDITYEISDY